MMMCGSLLILLGFLTMIVGVRTPKLLPWFIVGWIVLSGPALFLYSNWLAPALGWDVSSTFGIGYVTLPIALAVSCVLGAFLAFLFRKLRAT
jgi:hypothetical protein